MPIATPYAISARHGLIKLFFMVKTATMRTHKKPFNLVVSI